MDEERKAYLDVERAKWLTPHEVAYAWRVSLTYVLRQIRKGAIPYRGTRKQKRIHIDALTHYQEAQHDRVPGAPRQQTAPIQIIPRTPVHRASDSTTSRRLRAFDGGGRPRRTAAGA